MKEYNESRDDEGMNSKVLDDDALDPEELEEAPDSEVLDSEDFDPDDIDSDDAEWEAELFRIKRRKGCIIKTISVLVILAMLLFSAPTALYYLSDSLNFLDQNRSLLEDEIVKMSKPAVVSVDISKVGGTRQGTGFNIDSTGVIVTNLHVVEDAGLITVRFADGPTFRITEYEVVLGEDLAILRLNGTDLPYLQLAAGNNGSVSVGDEVTVIGNPLGFSRVSQRGAVLGLLKSTESKLPVMVIDIPVNPGNSGSPVIDSQGKVVAVVYASFHPVGSTHPEDSDDQGDAGTQNDNMELQPEALAISVQALPYGLFE